MFTTKLYNIFIAFSLTILVLSSALLTGTAFADGPTDANAFIAQLDNLRQLGQAQVAAARSTRLRQIAVFDHSGQLSALHARSVAVRLRGTSVTSAIDFATHLDQLRTIARIDANSFVARLDQLRQKGIAATATGNPSQVANIHVSQLDRLRELGQTQAAVARAVRLRQIAVFDHSGQLSALHNQVIIRQNRDTSIATANDFATHLARLQAMGYSDANTFVARLDRLRQLGTKAVQTPSQLATR